MKDKKFLLISLIIFFTMFFVQVKVSAADKVTIYNGDTQIRKLVIFLGDKNTNLRLSNNRLKGRWTSSDRNLVKVSKNGSIRGLKNGSAKVTYSYKESKKTRKLSVTVIVKTRVRNLSLDRVDDTKNRVEVPLGYTAKFSVTEDIGDRVREKFPQTKPIGVITYNIYSDFLCTTESEIGDIDSDGNLSVNKTGILYVRAAFTDEDTDTVYSNVYKINVVDRGTEYIDKEDSVSRIAISDNAVMSSYIDKDGIYFVTAYYRLFDKDNKDVTSDYAKYTDRVNIYYNGESLATPEPGKVILAFPRNNPKLPNPLGSTGELKITYTYLDKVVTSTKTIRISPPSLITNIEFKGIYRCMYSSTNSAITYENVLDKDNVVIKQGDEIKSFGNNIFMNKFPDSYYILFKVTDNYGNSISDREIEEDKIKISITGDTGIEIDTVENGKISSIMPVQIDGTSYLTYPLKPVKIRQGELSITIQGGTKREVIKKRITDGSSLLTFFVSGDNSYVGTDNILNYGLYTTKGESIRDYGRLLYYLGLTDNGSGMVMLYGNSNVISSNKGSTFMIKKTMDTGEAVIHYNPSVSVLLGNIGIMDSGVDMVTVLKGREGLERVIPIAVYRKK